MPTPLTRFANPLKRASKILDLSKLVKGKSRSSRRSSRRSRRATVGGRKTRKSPHKRR